MMGKSKVCPSPVQRVSNESESGLQQPLPANGYTPTEAERKALEEYATRKTKRTPCPKLKFASSGSTINLIMDCLDRDTGFALVMQALGSTDPEFATGLMTQLANAAIRKGEMNEEVLNFMLAVVKSVSPQDEIEAMLAAQMAAVHMMTMDFAVRLANANTIQQQDSVERALNKLTRTFATQVEALKRYRTGGQQKVTVEHVHVHKGGQAIVGHVEHKTGGGRAKKQ